MAGLRNINTNGFTLLETLLVLALFSTLAIVSTQMTIGALGSVKKTANIAKVKQSISYATSILERQLHNAQEVAPCPNGDTSTLTYVDQYGTNAAFYCTGDSNDAYIASGSARITGEDVFVSECSFSCQIEPSGFPVVNVVISAKDKTAKDPKEAASFSTSLRLFLRNY